MQSTIQVQNAESTRYKMQFPDFSNTSLPEFRARINYNEMTGCYSVSFTLVTCHKTVHWSFSTLLSLLPLNVAKLRFVAMSLEICSYVFARNCH